MGKIVIHDGVTNREIRLPGLRETIEVYVSEKRVEIPEGFETEKTSPTKTI